MRMNRFLISGAMVAAVVALPPTGASAQAVSLTGGVLVCPADLNDGSCNTVFRNRMELTGLTAAELNETVFKSCPGFPNGPYKRLLAPQSDIDYVILPVSSVNSGTTSAGPLSPGDIDAQIGVDVTTTEAGGTQVTIAGASGNSPTVTIKQTDPTVRSQIIDLPGFDFILFEKSQGGGAQVATLVCDIKMWFQTSGGSIEYGLQDFNVQHPINSMKIGFVAGPSGLKSQAFAREACLRAGNDEGAVDPDLEKKLSYLVGIYKVTALDQANPSNVTGCGLDDTDGGPLPVLANYCDASELAGTDSNERPNACNPDGEGGGIPEANIAGVNGNASTCYFTSRGTTYSFSC